MILEIALNEFGTEHYELTVPESLNIDKKLIDHYFENEGEVSDEEEGQVYVYLRRLERLILKELPYIITYNVQFSDEDYIIMDEDGLLMY